MKNLKKQGFTLVELLIVIALIIILLGVMIPAIIKVKDVGKKTMAETEAMALANAVKAYQTRYGMYPVEAPNNLNYYDKTGNEVLDMDDSWALLENIAAKNGDGVMLIELENYKREGDFVLDPYGNPYVFLMDMHDNDTNRNTNATGDEFVSDGRIQVSKMANQQDNSFVGRSGTYRIKSGKIKDTDIRTTDAKGGIRVLFFTGNDMEGAP
ncbi:MAG: prepilin-type N-terminal cleavage/methylation domain-containing protein [Kiritimatiellae bacterium]|jgi:prepilin-type N-terminal cleavage/methylation domain-containing protein|nr:prepilin-type N-terminal cleavage/methylation domain-containing protein [Kiritimatiellia bacterium]